MFIKFFSDIIILIYGIDSALGSMGNIVRCIIYTAWAIENETDGF